MEALPSVESVPKLTVAKIKEALTALGLPTDGLKAVLVERLEDALKQREAAGGEQGAHAQAQPGAAAAEPTAQGEKKGEPAQDGQQPASTAAPTSGETEEEKRAKRAERFNIPKTEEQKRSERAKRFGLDAAPGVSALDKSLAASVEEAKKAARGARFGTADAKAGNKGGKGGKAPADPEWEAKMLKRKERFGEGKIVPAEDPEIAEKKRQRALRFGLES